MAVKWVLLSTVFMDATFASSTAVSPLGQVLQMLDGMLGKCKAGKNTEETEFAAFKTWCDGARAGFSKSIDSASLQIQQLDADITKANSDAEELGADASEQLANGDSMEAEVANATAIRKKENEDYTATHDDLSESLDAIDRAKVVLRSRMADVKQTSLLQLGALGLPAEDKASIEALLSMSGKQAPLANAYEFQSTSVLDLLDNLRLKFQDQRLDLQKAEMAAKHNYEVLMQRLTDGIKHAKDVASKKLALKGERLEAASRGNSDRSSAAKGKEEDEKALSETTAECSTRSGEYEKNQVIRAEEIKAIESAVEILRSEDVSGNAETYLPAALLQSSHRGSALAQLRRGDGNVAARERAVKILEGQASKLGSRFLSLAATHTASDPFAKVKKLIQDLIIKLSEQANAEADHNSFCTSELAMNKQTRDDKQAEVDRLTVAAEKTTADIERLASELTLLSANVADFQQQRAEATDMRTAEKATNAKTVADAKEAQLAVERAIQILKEFYAQHAETSLLQQAAKEPYRGMQTESGNILGFLDVILSDFARLEVETSSAEDQSQESFERFMAESAQDLSVKQAEISHNEGSKRQLETSLASVKKELDLTHTELDAALSYYDKLKPDCVETGLSYEERREKRREEIQSLREALAALEQEDSV